MNASRHPVAQADEIPPGGRRLLVLGGLEIGLFRLLDGTYRAYQDYCPHAGAPLCNGEIIRAEPAAGGARDLPASAADSATASPQAILRCPWHGWEFDLATGAHVRLASCRLIACGVEVEGGTVFVTLPDDS